MKKFLIISLFFLSFIPVIVAADPTNIDPDVGTTLTTNCPSDTPDCYQLLEPIKLSDELTINSIDTAVNAAEGGGIGGFMNFLFEVAIGIAGVLGVVMLVYYGFRYAANDKNINEFSQLREKVTNVVLGLLLLLGTFVILKTINPDLLIVEPDIDSVGFELYNSDNNVTIPPSNGATQGTVTYAAANCAGGIIDIPSNFAKGSNQVKTICKDLSDKLAQVKVKTDALGFQWRITSTMDGDHQSSCHKKGKPKSGSCADIAISPAGTPGENANWGKLCTAVHSVSGLDFINEVFGNSECNALKNSTKTQKRTGNHLHVVYTGK